LSKIDGFREVAYPKRLAGEHGLVDMAARRSGHVDVELSFHSEDHVKEIKTVAP
jgi:hypothetical protein